MTIAGRAVLPTADGLLSGSGDDAAMRALRTAVDRALTSLPKVDSFVLLASGGEALIHDASSASLVGDGHPEVHAELRHDEQLLAALTSRGQTPRVRDDRITGPLGVLALLVHNVQPDACIQPVTVPRSAGGDALEAAAAGIVGAARATQRRIAVIAVGDLAVTGDGPSGAVFDAGVVAALRDDSAAALAELGPAAAAELRAAGWAPLTVLLRATGDRGPFAVVDYAAVAGVGRVVAHEDRPA